MEGKSVVDLKLDDCREMSVQHWRGKQEREMGKAA